MRTPAILAGLSVALLVVACSKPTPQADDTLQRDLDLALQDARPQATVSAVELGNARKEPMRAAAAPDRNQIAHAHHPKPQPVVEEKTPVATRTQPAPAPETQPVEAAPAPETRPVADDPQPQADAPAPEPEPDHTHTGRGGGWYPIPTDIGVDRPGLPGGIIIIRGGAGSANDPCDERDGHGHGGRRGGGIFGSPRFPGGIGGGVRFPGGGILR